MTDRLEWAKWMAAKGLSVFVVEPGTKHPLGGYSWYLRQSTDVDQIESWFKETEDCNWAVHPGSGHVVIDLDRKHGANGIKEFEQMCAEHGIDDFLLELDTLIVQTPSGGYHLYFKTPYPCANANSLPDGIDIRGAIGYVLGPASGVYDPAYRDGYGVYEVVDPNAPISDIPNWLLDYMYAPGQRAENADIPVIELDLDENVGHAKEWLQHRKPAIQGEEGDNWTYETINWLRDFGLSEEGSLAVLIDSGWNARCLPPWGVSELEVKIRNSWRYGQNRPGSKAPTYQVERLTRARPRGGLGAQLTDAQVAELFHPTKHLDLDTDEDVDEDIPENVDDDEIDPVSGKLIKQEQLWYDILDFMALPKVREYVVYNWIISHGITHLIAKRGTGKSTIALDLAFHLACDMDWCGIPIQTGWKVIYICGEDDEGLILNARAWSKHHEKSPPRNRFMVSRDIVKLTEESRLKLRLKEMLEWADGSPCVVILDTWQRATAGWGKNDQELMEKAVERAEWVAKTLKGPMISCVHPPKDGRMTIIGSGVQEDTSTGILGLTEVADGIKLSVDRIKGPGRGRYVKFDFKEIVLEGEDSFGKPLVGVVPVKVGGTEDEGKVEQVHKFDRELRAWAEAIRGCEIFPNEDNSFEPINTLNVEKVAAFLANMWEMSQEEMDSNIEDSLDAQDFKNRFMEGLSDFVVNMTKDTVDKRLREIFYVKTPPVVVLDNGTTVMEFLPKTNNTKAKKPHRVFRFRERKYDD